MRIKDHPARKMADIYISGGVEVPASLIDHTKYKVKKGDTLSEIAVKYRTSVSKIKRWNGLRNNLIYPGKKLVIHR